MINKILSTIFINTLVLYIIAKYIPILGFSLLSNGCISLEGFLLIGFVFWLINDIAKKIVGFITIPLKILTIGLFSIILNIIFLYIFREVINGLQIGVIIQLGNILQVLILSILIGVLNLLFKKL